MKTTGERVVVADPIKFPENGGVAPLNLGVRLAVVADETAGAYGPGPGCESFLVQGVMEIDISFPVTSI